MFVFKKGYSIIGPSLAMRINGNTYTTSNGHFEFFRFNKTLPKKNLLSHVLSKESLMLKTYDGPQNPNSNLLASCVYDPTTCYAYNTSLYGILDGTYKPTMTPFDERLFKDSLILGDSGVDINGDYYIPNVTSDTSGVIDYFRQSAFQTSLLKDEIRTMTFSFTVTCKEITNNTNFITWRPEEYQSGQSGTSSVLSRNVSICNRGGSICLYTKEITSPLTENTYRSKTIIPEKNKKINITMTYNSGLVKGYYNGEEFGEVNINISSFSDMSVGGNAIGVMSEVFPNGFSNGTLITYPFISHGIYAWIDVLDANEIKQICKYDGVF